MRLRGTFGNYGFTHIELLFPIVKLNSISSPFLLIHRYLNSYRITNSCDLYFARGTYDIYVLSVSARFIDIH